jgi:hypothetical protein
VRRLPALSPPPISSLSALSCCWAAAFSASLALVSATAARMSPPALTSPLATAAAAAATASAKATSSSGPSSARKDSTSTPFCTSMMCTSTAAPSGPERTKPATARLTLPASPSTKAQPTASPGGQEAA